MSYMTKDQLENYLNCLPSSNNKEKPKSGYSQIKSELVYPMQQLSLQQQQQPNHEQEEDVSYGTIQERMKRLRNATGTVLNASQTTTPAFPETPKPMVVAKPSFSSSQSDAFEASLNPRLNAQRRQQQQQQPTQNHQKPSTPPPLRQQDIPFTPPPAVPSSPRPPKPNKHNSASKNESMVRTLNPIYAGLECPACHKTIDGSVVSAMEQIWHAHCFRCSTCQKPLKNEKYYEKDDKPYCGKDYRNLFSLYCDFCHEPIENSAISALGKHYHEGHFCCAACQTPFGDHSAFMVHEGKPYCQDDYIKMCGKKCSGCGQYISGEYINALDQEWHKSCFNCFDCKRPFANDTFLVRDSKPYCEEHYHRPRQQQASPQRQAPVKQQQERKPPNLKPKPVISSRKPDYPPKPEVKQPEISNYNSSSSIKTETKNKKVGAGGGGPKVCHQCNSVIDGPSANALGYDYHIHHFQCSRCSRALSSRVPGMWQGDENNELICKMCAFKKTQ